METITLNGKVYILKEELDKSEESKKSYTHFTEISQLMNGLEGTKRNPGLFYGMSVVAEPLSEETVDKIERFGIMDKTNVCMIVAKTQPAKMFLRMYKYYDDEIDKVPVLFENIKIDKISKSKYKIEYIQKALKFLEVKGESIIITMDGEDYPIKLENDDFLIYIAPRVDNN